MNSITQRGYLVLADINGYTSFLNEAELTHAHEIMSELLELIIQRLDPILTLATIDGDAAFTYAADSKVKRGETLLELIESTYATFRDRLETIRKRTTCLCNACRSAPNLDLSFMTHHGEYLLRHKGGKHELIGVEVSLIRDRVLKDGIADQRGFALFTDSALQQMQIQLEGASAHSTSYESLSDVTFYQMDLRARYQTLIETRRLLIDERSADVSVQCDIAAPLPVVWEWLNDPVRRTQWMRGRKWRAELRVQGRTHIGARNHCDHAIGQVTEIILDWHPFDYVTSEISPASDQTMTQTIQLESNSEGHTTRLYSRVKFDTLPSPRWLLRPLAQMITSALLTTDYRRLTKMIEVNP